MMNIQEDYVSFEIAKLLKEKGFNEECEYFYDWYEDDDEYVICSNGLSCNDENYPTYYSMPTLSMAMKWLREVHKLYIEITPSSKTNEFIVDSYRIDIVTRFFDTIYVSSGYNTYEEACEAAIKYCLEHLI